MKKFSIILSTILSTVLLFSCGQNAEIERLQAKNDSLSNITKYSEIKIEEYLQDFNEIQENLNTIKEREKIISMQTSTGGELDGNAKEQINQDVQAMYDLMLENKQTIKNLKNKLSASGLKNSELQKTVKLFEQQLEAKDKELADMKVQLEQLNIEISDLNTEIADLNSDIDTLKKIEGEQKEVISDQDQKLNTAYYVYGTKKELIENGVLEKNGLFKKVEFDGDFDKTYFTKIDIRNTTELTFSSKKVELMTTHPSGSYEIVEKDGKVAGFKITDYNQFWQTSKFLVIMLK